MRFLAIIFLLGASIATHAQFKSTALYYFMPNPSHVKLITKGSMIAYSNCKTRDQGHSPLLYRGPEIYVRMFRERHRPTYSNRIEADLAVGNLLTRKKQTYYRTSLQCLRADLNYHFLIALSMDKPTQWKVGPMLGNVIDTRLYIFLGNNAFSYEFANYIGISTSVKRQFTIRNRRVDFSWRAHTSLIGHVIRPSFIGMEPAEAYEGPNIRITPILFHENKIALPNKFFYLRSEVAADLARPGKRDIKLFYAWSMTIDRVSNPLVQAKHQVGIGRSLTRNKRKMKFGFRSVFRKRNKETNPEMK